MEIQTFFLAEHLVDHRNGKFDARGLPFCNLLCKRGLQFPLRFSLPAFLLLRREVFDAEAAFKLRFDLVDEDGRPAGRPYREEILATFPSGLRFFPYAAPAIHFEFPQLGCYSLDITVDEGLSVSYQYPIDLREV